MKKVVDTRYAKSKDYKNTLETIEKINECPFCKENFKYHKKKILKTYKNWFITKNSWPYENAKFHFLIISEEHKEEFCDLKTSDFEIVYCLANWTIKKYKIKGGALTLRFGKTQYTGATVCHLHFHLIVPELGKNKMAKVINFPIG
ncbi:MAG: HIT domain-containing protein [Candidatus Pacebacteria bacterium]|nr:HIT domain-containing protein [Candidatus Paceibacterota bacterium]